MYAQNDATYEEKQYVVLACQQTVLRLFIQVYGLGEETVLMFIKKTKWPIMLSDQGANRSLSSWCVVFLEKKLDIPPKLLKEESFLFHFEAIRQDSGNDDCKDAVEETEYRTPFKTKSGRDKRWIVDLDGRFGIFRPAGGDQAHDDIDFKQSYARPILVAEKDEETLQANFSYWIIWSERMKYGKNKN